MRANRVTNIILVINYTYNSNSSRTQHTLHELLWVTNSHESCKHMESRTAYELLTTHFCETHHELSIHPQTRMNHELIWVIRERGVTNITRVTNYTLMQNSSRTQRTPTVSHESRTDSSTRSFEYHLSHQLRTYACTYAHRKRSGVTNTRLVTCNIRYNIWHTLKYTYKTSRTLREDEVESQIQD